VKRTFESEGIHRIIPDGWFSYFSFTEERIYDDIYNETGMFSIDYYIPGGFVEPEYFI